jgi:GT2 family glycosyltransferase
MNFGIGKAHGDFVFIHGDRLILERNCLEKLHETFEALRRAGERVEAVAPRFGGLDGFPPKSVVKPSSDVVELGRFTGDIYHDFSRTTAGPIKVPALHAYALILREAILGLGGYSEKFCGSHWRIESDLYLRLRRAGHELFYEPQAVVHPRIATVGGSRVGRLENGYFLLLNHAIYLLRNYGARSCYMIPAYTLTSIMPEKTRSKVLSRKVGDHGASVCCRPEL